jgi:positive regulator of sigma E activity
MKTSARVLEVTDERALLGCDSIRETCSACGGSCMLRRLAPGDAASLEVPRVDANGVPLEPGALVTVEVGGRDLFGAALRAALLPLAGAIAGPVVLRAIAADPAATDGVAVVSALVGLTAGWMTARLWLRHAPPRVAVRRDRSPPSDGEGGDAP